MMPLTGVWLLTGQGVYPYDPNIDYITFADGPGEDTVLVMGKSDNPNETEAHVIGALGGNRDYFPMAIRKIFDKIRDSKTGLVDASDIILRFVDKE